MDEISANSEIPSLGQVAFEAYRAEVVTAFNGDPIPAWDQLDNGAPARRGWEAAAQAVRQHQQMIGALDRAGRSIGVRPSRWLSLYGPADFEPPIGRGEPPTGGPVPVDAEPDDGR